MRAYFTDVLPQLPCGTAKLTTFAKPGAAGGNPPTTPLCLQCDGCDVSLYKAAHLGTTHRNGKNGLGADLTTER